GNQTRSGYWLGGDYNALYGPAYCTAMAVLALTVEYRYLPLYQRGEEPTERDRGQGFHPFPRWMASSVLPSRMVSPPGTLYRSIGGPFSFLLGRISAAAYLPTGIGPIRNEPSGWIGTP